MKKLADFEIDQIRAALNSGILSGRVNVSGGSALSPSGVTANYLVRSDGTNLVDSSLSQVIGGPLDGYINTKGFLPIADSSYDIGNPSVKYNNVYAVGFNGALIYSSTHATRIPYFLAVGPASVLTSDGDLTWNDSTNTLSATNLNGALGATNLTGTINTARLPTDVVKYGGSAIAGNISVASSYGVACGNSSIALTTTVCALYANSNSMFVGDGTDTQLRIGGTLYTLSVIAGIVNAA